MIIFNSMIHLSNMKLGIEFEHVEFKHVEDPKCLKFVRYFCFYFGSTKTRYGFCSYSELLQLRFGNNKKKTLQGNAYCSAPNTATWVSKVANERYLTYLQLCEKALIRIFMCLWCKSGQKLR